MDHISISETEWTVMKALWERSPLTLGEIYSAVNRERVWTRATVYVMVNYSVIESPSMRGLMS